MMFSELNATGYGQNLTFYDNEFEGVLSGIIACYNCVVSSKVILPNDENQIRDHILSNYLKKEWFKRQYSVANYLFDKEISEMTGRVDIRVMPVNPFVNDEAYYIIECKRLNSQKQTGISGLNAEYIKEGIYRFVSGKYSSYFKTNGMIGFVVDGMDIHNNIMIINNLLCNHFVQSNTIEYLTQRKMESNFEYSYYSKHSIDQKEILLYHLIFDFSKNIK